MVYAALIEDLGVEGASRFKVREIVDDLIGMGDVAGTERVALRAGETRAQRYQRLVAEQGDTMPERIGA